MKEKKQMSLKTGFAICYILILLGLFMVFFNYLNEKRLSTYEGMGSKLYEFKNETEILDESNVTEVNSDNLSDNYYIGRLKIPKINFDRGFVSPSNPDNTISKNIEIISPSDMPDIDKGNLIMAAHSGTAYISFFKNLYKLKKNDLVYISYKGYEYEYKIKNIYFQDKTGTIRVYRDESKTTLTLVTCTKDDKKTQTIYVAELNKKEKEGK